MKRSASFTAGAPATYSHAMGQRALPLLSVVAFVSTRGWAPSWPRGRRGSWRAARVGVHRLDHLERGSDGDRKLPAERQPLVWPLLGRHHGRHALADAWRAASPAACANDLFDASLVMDGGEPDPMAPFAYDAVVALAVALDRAADASNGTAVLDELRGVSWEGASGQVRFDAATGDRAADSVHYMVGIFDRRPKGRPPSWWRAARTTPSTACGWANLTWVGGASPHRQTGCSAAASGSSRGHQLDVRPCPAGHHKPAVGNSECIPCAAGSFAEVAGMTTCAACPEGSRQHLSGQASCSPCDVGSHAPAAESQPLPAVRAASRCHASAGDGRRQSLNCTGGVLRGVKRGYWSAARITPTSAASAVAYRRPTAARASVASPPTAPTACRRALCALCRRLLSGMADDPLRPLLGVDGAVGGGGVTASNVTSGGAASGRGGGDRATVASCPCNGRGASRSACAWRRRHTSRPSATSPTPRSSTRGCGCCGCALAVPDAAAAHRHASHIEALATAAGEQLPRSLALLAGLRRSGSALPLVTAPAATRRRRRRLGLMGWRRAWRTSQRRAWRARPRPADRDERLPRHRRLVPDRAAGRPLARRLHLLAAVLRLLFRLGFFEALGSIDCDLGANLCWRARTPARLPHLCARLADLRLRRDAHAQALGASERASPASSTARCGLLVLLAVAHTPLSAQLLELLGCRTRAAPPTSWSMWPSAATTRSTTPSACRGGRLRRSTQAASPRW